MPVEPFMLALSFAAGTILGTFYFLGLWLTLKRLPYSRKPVFLTLGSFFGRTGVSLLGFYLVVRGGHLERLLACFLGFMLMRFVTVRRLRPEKNLKEAKWLK